MKKIFVFIVIIIFCCGCGDTNVQNGNEINIDNSASSDQTSDNQNLIEKGECVDCSEAAQAAQDKMWEFLMMSFDLPETADAVYIPPESPDSQDISIAFEIYLNQTAGLENGGDPVEISNGFEDAIENVLDGGQPESGGATV